MTANEKVCFAGVSCFSPGNSLVTLSVIVLLYLGAGKALKSGLGHNNRQLRPQTDEGLHTPPSPKQVSRYCPKTCSLLPRLRAANRVFVPW